MKIARPVTDDGMVGYDEYNQFVVSWWERDTTVSTFGVDVRNMTCVICDQGWAPNGPSMRDQMRWHISDSMVHESCLVRHNGLRDRAMFWTALVDASVRFRGLRPEPNRYWPESDPYAKQPWYHAELIDHPVRFVLGARKRVYHVEIAAEGGTELAWWREAEACFQSENVTKEIGAKSVMLHAWGEDKVKEYVSKICELGGYKDTPEARAVRNP